MDGESKPKRRWFQFGLRTLFVVVLLVCFGFAWIARQLHRAREREAVVAELDKIDVYVYQYEPTALGRLTRAWHSLDYWLRTSFGDSLLSSPSAISAHHIGDDRVEFLIQQLRRFPALRKLHLGPLSEQNESRVRNAFPAVEVETGGPIGLAPTVRLLQTTEP